MEMRTTRIPAGSRPSAPMGRPRTPGSTRDPQQVALPPLPRVWPVIKVDVWWLVVLNAGLIAAMWLRHGGLDTVNTPGGALTAIGQITGLYAAYLALLQLVLMSRSPWLEQLFGMDRLTWAHRSLRFATVWLIVVHGIFTPIAYAICDNASVIADAWKLVTTYEWVLPAT